MNKFLPLFSMLMFLSIGGFSQSVLFEKYIQGTGGTLNDTLDNGTVVTLELSTDDVEQENDEVDSYYDDDLDAGWEGAPEDQNLLTLGLRFVDIMISSGVTVDSAFVVFHAHEGKSAEDVAELTIVGEATDNAVTFDEANFNDNNLLTDRSQTSAQVEWTVDKDWTIWQPYKTSDIGPIIQEILDRPGWKPGNAIALFFLPEDQGPSTVENAREFTSFENIADPDDVDPEGNPGDGTNHPERRPYIQIYVQGSLSTVELQSNRVSVYPNPAAQNGQVRIHLENNAPAAVGIVNIEGRTVKQFNVESGNAQLSLDGLSQGLYLLRITQNGETTTSKLVVE